MRRMVVFLLASLAGCLESAPPASEQAQPIIGGTNDTGDPSIVLLIAQPKGSQGAGLCTASLISPHVLLTAAHCVDPAVITQGQSTDPSTINFYVYPDPVLTPPVSPGSLLAVKETHFDAQFDQSAPNNGHDVGIVVLQNPMMTAAIPYNKVALPTSMMGQAARLVGYGESQVTNDMNADAMTAGTKRQAPTLLKTFDNILLQFEDGTHTICEGDSGGPALMKINGVETIVGLTSFGYMGCPTTQPGFDTRVDVYASFIDQYVNQFDGPNSGSPDLGTSGNGGSAGSGGGGGNSGTGGNGNGAHSSGGCTVTPGASGPAAALLVIVAALWALARRRARG